MDIFSLLSYINKVSLLAFFVTTLVVGYQVYILKKEKTKEQTPTIPDFKDKMNQNEVTNYTRLSDSLIKKDSKLTNYSKLIFIIISLLTVMVVVFVLILVRQNSSSSNSASVRPPAAVSPTTTIKPTGILAPSPTVKLFLSPSVKPTLISPSPTEIVLAQKPSSIPTESSNRSSPTQTISSTKPQTLPETCSLGKGLLIDRKSTRLNSSH